MAINWNWQRLIIAVVSAVLGWLSNLVVNVPGTQNIPSPVVTERKVPG